MAASQSDMVALLSPAVLASQPANADQGTKASCIGVLRLHVIFTASSNVASWLNMLAQLSSMSHLSVRYKVFVEGHDMQRVMGTVGVLGLETTSNDIMEVWKYLGVEAARKCIMSEIHKTMSSHGMSIDARHTMLLADCMTSKVASSSCTQSVSQECLWLSNCGVNCVDAVVLAGGNGLWQVYVLLN